MLEDALRHRVHAAAAFDALQLVVAAIGQGDARALDQVVRCLTDSDLAGLSQRQDAGGEMHGNAARAFRHELDLAGIDRNPDLDPEVPHRVADGDSAPDRASRPVEARMKAVAGGIVLDTSVSGELAPDSIMVPLEERRPGSVADLAQAIRRADDVSEQDLCKHALPGDGGPGAGQELLDRVEDLVHVVPGNVDVTAQLDEASTGDAGRHVAPLLDARVGNVVVSVVTMVSNATLTP